MFERLRTALLQRSLRRLVEHSKRRRYPYTLQTARSVALLFDASEEETRKIITLWAEGFAEREPRKRLLLLGFVDDEHVVGQTRFPQFTSKEIRWNGQPAGAAVERFLEETPDLLLCFNPRQLMPIQWVAAASKANMKIGNVNVQPNDFDFILETPPEKDAYFFLREVAFYLSKIIPAHHEQLA